MAELKALILAGGFGKRLRPFTNEVPKPMLPVAGRPLIEWQMQWLKKRNGIDDLVLCVVNGDILTTIELTKLARSDDTHAIAAAQMRNPFGVISTTDDKDVSYVKEFLQKPLMDDIWINAGVYYFQRDL